MSKKRSSQANGAVAASVSPEQRRRMIAEAAYYRALQRGFVGGSSEDDWLRAEREINNALLQVADATFGAPTAHTAFDEQSATGSRSRRSTNV